MSLPTDDESGAVAGRRVAFVGKLAGMSRRDAGQFVRDHGGLPVEGLEPPPQVVVLGEAELPLSDAAEFLATNEALRLAARRGELTVITETQLWQQLGFVEGERHIHRLYTPAMLADLLGVPVAVVRRWRRRGLIVPAREVRRLAYFDFQEVATARRLAELLAAGVSPRKIEQKLAALGRLVPEVARPLAQLSVIVEGNQLLLRQGDGLLEPGGQLRFDFGLPRSESSAAGLPPVSIGVGSSWSDAAEGVASESDAPASPDQMRQWAARLDDEGRLEQAADAYRTALVAGGPDAETCFLLAELLYRLGDVTAARERYYMAIELDEDYVEARANLGCVLAETGQPELAVAAFEGALAYHRDYPDVHYHLARTLDELGRRDEAQLHWRIFLDLTPDSPWATAARERLGGAEEW
jgi:tetratricopeptide (TPR) repeat protein